MSNFYKTSAGKCASAARVLITVALCASLCTLCGCSPSMPAQTENAPVTASDYMVSLNDRSAELSKALEEFSAAINDGKISAMQQKADEAYAILDEMSALEAPENIGDLKNKYNDAAGQLKDALDSYISLYTEVFDSTEASISSTAAKTTFDTSVYGERLESIQKQYDDAMNALEEADKMSAEM